MSGRSRGATSRDDERMEKDASKESVRSFGLGLRGNYFKWRRLNASKQRKFLELHRVGPEEESNKSISNTSRVVVISFGKESGKKTVGTTHTQGGKPSSSRSSGNSNRIPKDDDYDGNKSRDEPKQSATDTGVRVSESASFLTPCRGITLKWLREEQPATDVTMEELLQGFGNMIGAAFQERAAALRKNGVWPYDPNKYSGSVQSSVEGTQVRWLLANQNNNNNNNTMDPVVDTLDRYSFHHRRCHATVTAQGLDGDADESSRMCVICQNWSSRFLLACYDCSSATPGGGSRVSSRHPSMDDMSLEGAARGGF